MQEIHILQNYQNTIPPQAPRKHTFRNVFLFIVFVFLIAVFSGYFYLKHAVATPYSKNANLVNFDVSQGEHALDISKALYAQKLISDPWIFDLYIFYLAKNTDIKAGSYVLGQNLSMRQIAEVLTGGQNSAFVVRIKEGSTLQDIADTVNQKNIMTGADFLSAAKRIADSYSFFGETPKVRSLQGYLFPDTYYVIPNETADQLIQRFLDNTAIKITPQMRGDTHAQNKSIYDVITLASIIEKEVGRNTATLSEQDLQTLDSERKIVAGIFYNRLRLGMHLESDATVVYLTGKHSTTVSAADLQIDSPYNTYKYAGLPPGPISNPSLSSIMAAIYPQQTDYLYFLTKPDGTAVFARTYSEQKQNIKQFLK